MCEHGVCAQGRIGDQTLVRRELFFGWCQTYVVTPETRSYRSFTITTREERGIT
jgi:hypothetical protein